MRIRIEWLNTDRTLARVTRGWLWWKRVAVVERSKAGEKLSGHTYNWRHKATGAWVHLAVDCKLDRERNWYPLGYGAEHVPPPADAT